MKKILLLLTFLTSIYSVSNAQCTNTITAGTIGSDQTICYNTIHAIITQLTAPTGTTGPLSYTWETSSDGISWTSSSNLAWGQEYSPLFALTQDAYIRRVITDLGISAPCNTATSNTIHITVPPLLTAGVISGDETFCRFTTPATITQTTASPNGAGAPYQWQVSAGFNGFVDITGATNSSYSPSMLVTTTSYRRLETSGNCGMVVSNVITKIINSLEPSVSINSNAYGQTCPDTEIIFTATTSNAGNAPFYQWYLGTTPIGTNSETLTYTTTLADNGKNVTVEVTPSISCNKVTSSRVLLNIVSSITPTVTIGSSNNGINCSGFSNSVSVLEVTNAGILGTFQWYVNSNPVGTGSTYYAIYNNGDQVWVDMTSTSTLSCIAGTNPYRSNTIVMDIRPIPISTINEGDQTICTGESFTFTSTSISIVPQTRLQWFKGIGNGSIQIPGATNNSYTAKQSGSYYIKEDNGVCNTSSVVAILTVDPCGSFSTTITGPNPVMPGQQNAVYGVPNQTGFTYTWSVTGGTIVSGQNTNAVTVDWDAPVTNSFARTTSTPYSISVLEKNTSNQTKTTTSTINTIATAVTQSQAQSGINVFPNPTTGTFNIEMPESGVAVSYVILDLTGLTVASGTFISTGNDQTISADLDAGMYQIVLTYNNFVTCVRLSKVQ